MEMIYPGIADLTNPGLTMLSSMRGRISARREALKSNKIDSIQKAFSDAFAGLGVVKFSELAREVLPEATSHTNDGGYGELELSSQKARQKAAKKGNPIRNLGSWAIHGFESVDIYHNRFYGILAPLVVPIALIFTKWSAERLSTLFWQWDNNINPNGDNGPWNEVPKTYFHNGDRRVVTEHHYQSENPDDISAFERCYWAEGHHPRSAWARYIWLGWRNRAKAMYQSMGKPVDLTIVDEFWGNPNQNRSIEGTHVRTNNGLWQMRRTKKMVIKYWPGKALNMCLVQNFGYKVNNAHAEQKVLAMPVYIMSAIKRWEGE